MTNAWMIFFFAAALQGIFLAALFFLKKTKGFSRIFLALLIVTFSLNMMENVIYWTKSYSEYPHLLRASRGFVFLWGPLFYFFIHSLISKIKLKKSDLIHLMPFIIYILYMLPFYFLSAEAKIYYMNNRQTLSLSVQIFSYLYPILACSSLIFYSIICMQKTKQFTNTKQVFLLFFSNSFLVFSLSFTTYYVLVNTIAFKPEYDYIISLIMAWMIYQISYYAFLKPIENLLERPTEKYEKSALVDINISDKIAELEQIIHNEKLFLESGLKLAELAKRIELSSNQLSQLLNAHKKISFSDYINSLRVEEAKKLLSDSKNDHFTILAIAYDAGFNNKTSFNQRFKELVGVSPSEFRTETLKESVTSLKKS